MPTTVFKLTQFARCCLFSVLLALLTACSESGGIEIQVAEGGISGTGISSGSITGFSSVILNGRKLEITSQTEILVDEQSATQAELKVGYVVRVDADFDNSTARRIDYVETVRGPLVALPVFNPDTLVGNFSLLGQTVVTNSVTSFDGLSDLSTLAVGDVLEVSGVRDSSGAVIARYLSLKTPPITKYRVLGKATQVTATTFDIGSLRVDYSSADLSGLGNGGIANGDELRVKGLAVDFDVSSTPPSLNASKITPSSLRVELVSGSDIELEGAITEFRSISDFKVNGLPVDAGGAIIENGTASELQRDLLVEVEGRVDNSNTDIASRVKIIPLSNIRLESAVDSVDPLNQSIMVQGRQFILDEKTQLEDKSSVRIKKFSLGDLSSGDYVRIRAYALNGELFLTRLERDKSRPDVRIQAPVDENGIVQNSSVSLLGITVSTDSNTSYEDIGIPPPTLTQAGFFSKVKDFDLVKAKWKNFTGNIFPVDSLSIEEN